MTTIFIVLEHWDRGAEPLAAFSTREQAVAFIERTAPRATYEPRRTGWADRTDFYTIHETPFDPPE